MRRYIAEFMGTFLLVFVGCGTAVAAGALFSAQGFLPVSFSMLLSSVAFGVTLAALTYAFGKISGGHLNPAVSLAMWVTRKMSFKDLIRYVISQLTGGVGAAALLILILGGRTSLGANGYGSLSTFGVTLRVAILVEVVITFFFVLVVMQVRERDRKGGVSALVSGLTMTAAYLFATPFTGGSANPARSLGPALLQGGDALKQVWVFLASPLAGALLAALVYFLLNYNPVPRKLLPIMIEGPDTEEA